MTHLLNRYLKKNWHWILNLRLTWWGLARFGDTPHKALFTLAWIFLAARDSRPVGIPTFPLPDRPQKINSISKIHDKTSNVFTLVRNLPEIFLQWEKCPQVWIGFCVWTAALSWFQVTSLPPSNPEYMPGSRSHAFSLWPDLRPEVTSRSPVKGNLLEFNFPNSTFRVKAEPRWASFWICDKKIARNFSWFVLLFLSSLFSYFCVLCKQVCDNSACCKTVYKMFPYHEKADSDFFCVIRRGSKISTREACTKSTTSAEERGNSYSQFIPWWCIHTCGYFSAARKSRLRWSPVSPQRNGTHKVNGFCMRVWKCVHTC